MPVLYRKYRPKTFGEIIGQEHVTQTLKNAVKRGLISHAYLFAGPRGSGKTTIARLFAKTVNCQVIREQFSDTADTRPSSGGEMEPCNKCLVCEEINAGRAMDLIEIDAASHRGIDEVRQLKEEIGFSPSSHLYKVYIIDEAHQLTPDAANALLKTLEEPPQHAIFILATTEPHKMISTIVSRCQRFDFKRLTLEQIMRRLELVVKAEKAGIEKPALELIALHSGGSLRDAESILDQILTFAHGKSGKITADDVRALLGLAEIKTVAEFAGYLFSKDLNKGLKAINELYSRGYDLQVFAKAVISYLRQGLVSKIDPELYNPFSSGLTPEQYEFLKKQVGGVGEGQLQLMLELLLEAENKMRYSPLPQLPLELAVVEIISQK